MDPWHPTVEELEEWAAIPAAEWHDQDWHLSVTRKEFLDLVFRLASDNDCPNHQFFLRCLYLFVGDAVRTNFGPFSRALVQSMLEKVSEASPVQIRRWRDRSIE